MATVSDTAILWYDDAVDAGYRDGSGRTRRRQIGAALSWPWASVMGSMDSLLRPHEGS